MPATRWEDVPKEKKVALLIGFSVGALVAGPADNLIDLFIAVLLGLLAMTITYQVTWRLLRRRNSRRQ